MKKKFFSTLIMGMFFVTSLLSLTACGDDNEPNTPMYGKVVGFNGLKWFGDNLVLTDNSGNLVEYINGRPIDPANPQTLFIGVDSEKEAASIFQSWLAPETKSQLTVSSDGSMTYVAKDEGGKKLGEIYYKVREKGEELLSVVRFSADVSIPYVDEVCFILNDLWPDNDEVVSQYKVGDIVESNQAWYGMKRGVCIREAEKDRSGLILYLSKNEYQLGHHDYPELPSLALAKEVANILQSDWISFASAFHEAGSMLSQTDHYWLNHTVDILPVYLRAGILLNSGTIHWFDCVSTPTKQLVMVVRTF